MTKYIFFLLFSFPCAAWAQLAAVSPDAVKPTRQLTGTPESVYVFFDKTSATLTAHDTGNASSTFTWRFLNTVDTTFAVQHTEPDVTASSLTVSADGGYQVRVQNALRDTTFSCWVFFDTFKIDTVTFFSECEGLQLTMVATPKIRNQYIIYNFNDFLNPPHLGDSTFSGWQSIRWDSGTPIHEGVDNADESWKQRNNSYSTVIASPPPLGTSDYSVTVTDVFGKSATYTTPYTVPAIAAYAKITAEESKNEQWQTASDPPKGEALYRIRFSHDKSLNIHKFYWKGFSDQQNPTQTQQLMWQDSTTTTGGWVTPRVPYKNELRDGYLPGKYAVRLTVLNTVSGCADSTELTIEVEPSKFSAEAIPNAFTPNGDGQNDIFRFVKGNEPVSMEYIKVYVFDRSGALVYRYEGRVDAWQGWNGQRMGTGGDVADGVYFYIVSGEGWDGKQYDTSEYKGAVHIFR